MANLKIWLERAENEYEETIEAVVVGQHYNNSWDNLPQNNENKVLGREEGLAKLNQEYNNGYGGADCFPFYAWTKNHIFFVCEYDGATSLGHVPRNPIDIKPEFM